MPYSPNIKKEEFVKKYGQTAGLPLFDQIRSRIGHWPDWLWDGSEVKSEAYEIMKAKFNVGKVIYLQTSIKLGGKATDNEIKANSVLEINIITARRKNLQHEGVVSSFDGAKKNGPFGISNTIWFLNYKALQEILYR